MLYQSLSMWKGLLCSIPAANPALPMKPAASLGVLL